MGLKPDNFLSTLPKNKVLLFGFKRGLIRCAISGSLLFWWSSPAQAETLPPYPPCTGTPSKSDVDAAMGAFQAGRISFEEGDYDRAILYWEDAFRRDCTAVKQLLNVARVYELKGDLQRALLALETYRERSSDISDPGVVEKRIAKLKERIAGEQPPPEEEAPVADARKVAPPPPPPEPVEPRNARPLWPVFATVGGVSILAVGTTFAVLGGVAVGNEKDRIALEVVQLPDGTIVTDPGADGKRCSRKGRNWNCPSTALQNAVTDALDESDELKRSKIERSVGILVASAGAVATGVGAYFWYRLWSSPKHPQSASTPVKPAILPIIAPGYQGVSLVGRF